MIFVRMGQVIAWLPIIGGVAGILMGFIVTSNAADPAAFEAAQRRYLGSSSPGESIDRGFMWIALGVAMGLLARIANRAD